MSTSQGNGNGSDVGGMADGALAVVEAVVPHPGGRDAENPLHGDMGEREAGGHGGRPQSRVAGGKPATPPSPTAANWSRAANSTVPYGFRAPASSPS